MVCSCDPHSCQCSHTSHILNSSQTQELSGEGEAEGGGDFPGQEVCGPQCYLVLSVSLVLLSLLVSLSLLYYRRQGCGQSKYRATASSSINQDYHSSLHQTSSISTIHTNCTNNR